MRFLMLSPKAQAYYQQLEQRRMNPHQHIIKIVALSEIYGVDPVARAIEDAFVLQAYSCEYIANLLEQRARKLPEPGALILHAGRISWSLRSISRIWKFTARL